MKNFNIDNNWPIKIESTSIPDAVVPRMEVLLKTTFPYSDMEVLNSTEGLAIAAVEDYLRTSGNEKLISINCADDIALNYYICSEGTNSGTDGTAGTSNAVKAALLSNATSIVLLHNHPFGRGKPSEGDLKFLSRLCYLCDLIDVKVTDMFIVGKNDELYSCRRHHPEYFEVHEEKFELLLPDTEQTE